MARTPTQRRPAVESLTATVCVGGTPFPFRLHSRPLRLGPDLTVQYYWMDSSRFRITRARRRSVDPANCRACVGHWWRAMQVSGWAEDADQIRHLLLAATYPLISADKGLQHVYRDAHLAPRATAPEERSLPDDVRSRLQALVRGRDCQAIQAELDHVLGAWTMPPEEEPAVRQAIDGILEHGTGLVRDHGAAGLEQFLGRFDAWAGKTRRTGGQPYRRRLLDGLSYLSKASFYLCYGNAWIDLIPWLRQHRGLDAVSERFLRFWHMQNQPVEWPDGTHAADVFRGQVLSLHPLSGFFMKDPGLCAIAGRFFATDAYDRVFHHRQADTPAYWDLIGAILTAAHLYRQALDDQQQRRGVHERAGAEAAAVAAPAARSLTGLLDEYAVSRGLHCLACRGPVHLHAQHVDPTADDVCQATCPGCNRPVPLAIHQDELQDWLATR